MKIHPPDKTFAAGVMGICLLALAILWIGMLIWKAIQ